MLVHEAINIQGGTMSDVRHRLAADRCGALERLGEKGYAGDVVIGEDLQRIVVR
ncbi:hypothetical protein [Nocardia miyunensis]|uniref:hypothetical protein n=1 Tax=Nocardia miyunensis TaxID=282684 RepID=UPI000AB355DA|nr:hypothetical protein [Nocardia miyunensis]